VIEGVNKAVDSVRSGPSWANLQKKPTADRLAESRGPERFGQPGCLKAEEE